MYSRRTSPHVPQTSAGTCRGTIGPPAGNTPTVAGTARIVIKLPAGNTDNTIANKVEESGLFVQYECIHYIIRTASLV